MRELVARVRGSHARAAYPGLPSLQETVVVGGAPGPAAAGGVCGARAHNPGFDGALSRLARVGYPGTPSARGPAQREPVTPVGG